MLGGQGRLREGLELGEAIKKELLARGVAVKSEVVRAEAVSRSEVRRLARDVDRTEADSLLFVSVKGVRLDPKGVAWVRYDFSFFDMHGDDRIWRGQIEVAGAHQDDRVIEDMALQLVDRLDTDALLARYQAAGGAAR